MMLDSYGILIQKINVMLKILSLYLVKVKSDYQRKLNRVTKSYYIMIEKSMLVFVHVLITFCNTT